MLFVRRAGTRTTKLLLLSIARYGFSGIRGVLVMTVNFEPGQLPAGGFETPTKTMFQFCPDQFPQISLRESHCCCVRELTVESILESARKPPLDQAVPLVFDRFRFPLMCIRRSEVPCETAHVMVLEASNKLEPALVGTTVKFSQPRQKLIVALCSDKTPSE